MHDSHRCTGHTSSRTTNHNSWWFLTIPKAGKNTPHRLPPFIQMSYRSPPLGKRHPNYENKKMHEFKSKCVQKKYVLVTSLAFFTFFEIVKMRLREGSTGIRNLNRSKRILVVAMGSFWTVSPQILARLLLVLWRLFSTLKEYSVRRSLVGTPSFSYAAINLAKYSAQTMRPHWWFFEDDCIFLASSLFDRIKSENRLCFRNKWKILPKTEILFLVSIMQWTWTWK